MLGVSDVQVLFSAMLFTLTAPKQNNHQFYIPVLALSHFCHTLANSSDNVVTYHNYFLCTTATNSTVPLQSSFPMLCLVYYNFEAYKQNIYIYIYLKISENKLKN